MSTQSKMFASVILMMVVLAVAFSTRGGGLFSALMALIAFCTTIAWIVQSMIDRKVAKKQK